VLWPYDYYYPLKCSIIGGANCWGRSGFSIWKMRIRNSDRPAPLPGGSKGLDSHACLLEHMPTH
jgi:hypothetical protein